MYIWERKSLMSAQFPSLQNHFLLKCTKIFRKRIILLSILLTCEERLIQINMNHFHDEKEKEM